MVATRHGGLPGPADEASTAASALEMRRSSRGRAGMEEDDAPPPGGLLVAKQELDATAGRVTRRRSGSMGGGSQGRGGNGQQHQDGEEAGADGDDEEDEGRGPLRSAKRPKQAAPAPASSSSPGHRLRRSSRGNGSVASGDEEHEGDDLDEEMEGGTGGGGGRALRLSSRRELGGRSTRASSSHGRLEGDETNGNDTQGDEDEDEEEAERRAMELRRKRRREEAAKQQGGSAATTSLTDRYIFRTRSSRGGGGGRNGGDTSGMEEGDEETGDDDGSVDDSINGGAEDRMRRSRRVLTRAQSGGNNALGSAGSRRGGGGGGAGTGDEGAGGRVYPRRERKSVTYLREEQEEEEARREAMRQARQRNTMGMGGPAGGGGGGSGNPYATRYGGGGGDGGMPMRNHRHHSLHSHGLVPAGGGGGHGGSHGHHNRRSRHGRHGGGRQRHYDSSSMSESSGDSDSDADANFHRYQRTKWKEDLRSIQPINGGNNSSGGVLDRFGNRDISRADAMPLEVDQAIDWDSVGGLREHITALKEMVMFPLLYPEYFQRFSVTPPRGVLFYGPPGTGKTLMARALASTCSKAGKHVSFFMRKGADCLSKWVGEAERQLRLLFEQARRCQPSIIFFDEIDGLAPVRSSKQDQIHASIVSTLLALMDGLDDRGQVIVIGATNRPDAVDPALRRPGRFDRELGFTLPDAAARRQILDIHTRKWNPPLAPAFKNELAERTVGYCGADLKALCTEAAMRALRRRYPQVYESTQKLLIKQNEVLVLRKDFADAMRALAPAAHRSALSHAAALPTFAAPLLGRPLHRAIHAVVAQGMLPSSALGAPTEATHTTKGAAAVAGAGAGPTTEQEDDDFLEDEAEVRAVYGIINRNACERCGRRTGALVCCDACPAAYHEGCIPPEAIQPDLASDAPWKCPPCAVKEGEDGGATLGAVEEELTLGAMLACMGASGAGGGGGGGMAGNSLIHRPRLLIHGGAGQGQALLGAALLHKLESLPVFPLDLPSLLSDAAFASPEQCLVTRITEARRSAPSVLYLPRLDQWFTGESGAYYGLREALLVALEGLPPSAAVLVLATYEAPPTDDADDDAAAANEDDNRSTASLAPQDQAYLPRELRRLFSLPGGLRTGGILALPPLLPLPLPAPAAAVSAASASAASARMEYEDEDEDEEKDGDGNGGNCHTLALAAPGAGKRRAFFGELVGQLGRVHLTAREEAARAAKARARKRKQRREVLPVAPSRPDAVEEDAKRTTEAAANDPRVLARKAAKEEHLKREFRICLRQVLAELRKDKRYSYFAHPVDPEDVPDYYQVIARPMDLDTMRIKVDQGLYATKDEFRGDVLLIQRNAREYNPCGPQDTRGKAIVSAACNMVDHVDSMFFNFRRNIGYDLFQKLEDLKNESSTGNASTTASTTTTTGPALLLTNGRPAPAAVAAGAAAAGTARAAAGAGGRGTRSSRRLRGSGGGEDRHGELFLELGPDARTLKVQGQDTPTPSKRPRRASVLANAGSSNAAGEKEEENDENAPPPQQQQQQQQQIAIAAMAVVAEAEAAAAAKAEGEVAPEKEGPSITAAAGSVEVEPAAEATEAAAAAAAATEAAPMQEQSPEPEEGADVVLAPPTPGPPTPKAAATAEQQQSPPGEAASAKEDEDRLMLIVGEDQGEGLTAAESAASAVAAERWPEPEPMAVVDRKEQEEHDEQEREQTAQQQKAAETVAAPMEECEEAQAAAAAAAAAAAVEQVGQEEEEQQEEEEEEEEEEASQVEATLPPPPTFAPIAAARLEGLHAALVAGTERWPVERLLALRGALWRELALCKKALKQQHGSSSSAAQAHAGQVALLTTDAVVDRMVAYVGPRG